MKNKSEFILENLIYLCNKVKECFESDIEINLYGSYSTGLEIFSSDLDISFNLLNEDYKESSFEILISKLENFLLNDNNFENIFPIINTSVPILKLQLKNQKKPEIITKFDITFYLQKFKQTIDFYINSLKKYPEIKPLTLIFKLFLYKNNLNRVFDGGISSHSLFIMIASNIILLKNNNLNKNISYNLGEIFIDILRFYGKIFQYQKTIIDILNKNNPYIINQEFSKVPIFIDPISNINIAKSSFRFDLLQEKFYEIYLNIIKNENFNFLNEYFINNKEN